MIQVFDVKSMKAHPYEKRDMNVFYKAKEFKVRIIELPAGGEMPTCEMASYVLFYVIEGTAEVMVDQEKMNIKEGQCFITEPATLSMQTDNGVKIMGVQVMKH